MSNVIQTIINVIAIVVVLLPPAIEVTQVLVQKAHNTKLENLLNRAKIIVNALQQSGLTNAEKKQAALAKLSEYAKEVGINVTTDQIDDYIEAAVKFMNLATK
jgi:predicted PurR-regulated permease PerM